MEANNNNSNSAEKLAKADQFDHMYKVMLLGDSGCGKTSLMKRFTRNEFFGSCTPTIGVDLDSKIVDIDGHSVKAQIWDTSGTDRFSGIRGCSCRGAAGAIIVFDLSNHESFDNVQKWCQELFSNAYPDVFTLLVGNKADLDRNVDIEEINTYCNINNISYLETSALDSRGIEDAFRRILTEIYRRHY